MADDHRNIQHPTGRCSGKTAHGKADTLGKIAQKVEHSPQKNGKRQPLLLEKAMNVGIHVKKQGLYIFSTWIKR